MPNLNGGDSFFGEFVDWMERGAPHEPSFKEALAMAYSRVATSLVDDCAAQVTDGLPEIANEKGGDVPAAVTTHQYRILGWDL